MIEWMNRDETGSLPVVLIAAIVLGGLLVALFTVTQRGTLSARQDRDFANAFQVADAGMQEAFVRLRDVGPENDEHPTCDDEVVIDPADTDADGICEGTLKDGTLYRWQYERLGDRTWRVISQGTRGGSTRTLQALVGETPLFPAAVVSDEKFTFGGGGNADGPFPLGGFNDMVFNGNGTGSLIETLYLFGDNNEPTGNHAPDSENWEVAEGPELINIGALAFQEGGVCDWETPPDETFRGALENPLQRGHTYCLRGEANFRNNTTGNVTLSSGDEPVNMYIETEGFKVQAVNVNGAGDAEDLRVFVGAGEVTMGGNFNVSAAIHAPASACTSGGQGGGGFAGGLVCNTVTLNGNFRYDPSIGSIMDGTYGISSLSEQPGLRVAG